MSSPVVFAADRVMLIQRTRPIFRIRQKSGAVPMTAKKRPSEKELKRAKKALEVQAKVRKDEATKKANQPDEDKPKPKGEKQKTKSKKVEAEDKKEHKTKAQKTQPGSKGNDKAEPKSILKRPSGQSEAKPQKKKLSFDDSIAASANPKKRKVVEANAMPKEEANEILKALEECFMILSSVFS